jgi:arsenate reductase (glutaredoxin)
MKADETYTVYGIKNCDTVKKALRWLDEHNVRYVFHDYKSKGISEAKLKEWISQLGREALVNKKGLTFKQLPEETRSGLTSNAAAIAIMKEKTSLIKRPLIEKGKDVHALGFDPGEYEMKFSGR